jgi:pimeloyl-ACP methyl ester carboxylesterase
VEPKIGFCTTPDGARIAYTSVGEGSPLVVVPALLNHQELNWQLPILSRYFERLAQHHNLVQYDPTGTGLSDRQRTDFSIDADIRDLEAVIDHLKLKRLILMTWCFGGPIAIAYTSRHPRRVSHLILYATYACGATITTDDVKASTIAMVRAHWGVASRMFGDVLSPSDAAHSESMAKFLRESATSETAARILEFSYRNDVVHLLPGIRIPTLVLHRRGDRAMPFRGGRELASLIPNARFVPLEGIDHLPSLGDTDSVLGAVAEFLGDPVKAVQGGKGQPASTDFTVPKDDPVTHEAWLFIAALDRIVLSRYRVIGDYTRYEETVRNMLKDVRYKIAAAFAHPGNKRENHLIWAAPGSGKTYFAQQVAAGLSDHVHYQECNLAKCGREEFLSGLSQLDANNKPCLCLIDEADAKPGETWPYEVLLPYLDAAVDRGKQFVFVLAGSSGVNIADIKEQIARRPKGADLLSRIPANNEYEIPSLKLGDRMLVVLSQFKSAGKDSGREIREVEKLGLYYIALNSRLTNARQLRELAVRAIERMPSGEDRMKYDHLFGAGDPENKAFWMQSLPATEELSNRFVIIED